jgi:beta-glucuronidase
LISCLQFGIAIFSGCRLKANLSLTLTYTIRIFLVHTRRNFLKTAPSLALGASLAETGLAASTRTIAENSQSQAELVSLNGTWQFRFDSDAAGQKNGWFKPAQSSHGWQNVEVPHTWQIAQDSAGYFGLAWYRRMFEVPRDWRDKTVRIEFEAVFHSASVWVNGNDVGQHLHKGYTAFEFDITRLLHPGADNVLVVMVNSDFDNRMLPRGHSSDWTHDGGIYRPVSLLITPQVYVERVGVDAVPDLANATATLAISAVVRNATDREFRGRLAVHAIEEDTGITALQESNAAAVTIPAGTTITRSLPPLRIANCKLWHFDAPNLYSLSVGLNGTATSHAFTTTFGIRSIEVKDGSFWLNGERVRFMGVERMAGCNPNYGMAEPTSWIDHDHDDLKNLNCVFTRVHWQQDKRVLDYCDRHGIFIQTEVPTWGPDTFAGMKDEPDPEIMQNGLEQLREMIARDRNHPSIFSWGLCNEINGQNPPAYNFAKRMYEEAKLLDPRHLRSYASNSLQKDPGNDVSKFMDFVECNEYWESWSPGTVDDLRRSLEEIHRAFPDKPIVISEYGWCACTPDRSEGDARRAQVLREHTRVFRETSYVGGVIFFCYNDYRTHIGDKGTGVMKQRIHGVVDLFGARKPSYPTLRRESSPIESLEHSGVPGAFTVTLRTRDSVPAYTLRGYKLRGILYGFGNIPLESRESSLPPLTPGQTTSVPLQFKEKEGAMRVEFDVLRPTGFSAITSVWIP